MEKNHNSVNDDQPVGVAEPRRAPRPKATSPRRKDAKRLHITHRGILSRAPMEALVHRGVSLRELRKIERLLRVQLRPQGIFAELIFDRAWASYLRCALIADVEKQAFTRDHPTDGAARLPALSERERPTLVFGDDAKVLNGFSPELMSHLLVVQRY